VTAVPFRAPGVMARSRDALTKRAAGALSAVVKPHRASLRRLAEMPLSVIGTGCMDFAAFHVDHGVGFLVAGISLWVIEHLISDDDDVRPR